MRTSLRGHILPESEAEYKQIIHPLFTSCFGCKAPFTSANVHTQLGWAETQISGRS